jgi:hypothetical protein
MTNAELVRQFESDTIEGEFHHADHVRMVYAYLSQYPVLEALDRFSAALKRYAEARGKSGLYHETITFTYFFLVRERMAHAQDADWDDFAARNPDLFVWKDGILSRYYQEATLQSELARSVFIFPDRIA